MNSFLWMSGGVVRKQGTKEKEVSLNLMVCAASVFCRWEFEELDGLWERVGWGKYMAADYSSRHQWNQAITPSMEQFLVKLPGSSQILQWGGVWESSDWRMPQTFPAGSFQKSLHCNGNASKYHLLSEGLSSIDPQCSSAVHWWLTWWSWLNTEPIWMKRMFLQLKCGEVV